MARHEIIELESAAMAAGPSATDIYFRLGLIYSTGVDVDKVAAHKWFNLAAVGGNREAVLCRRELAAEMNENEIAAALRAAREWRTRH